MTATVSVILCTYNGGRYLRQQIDSILAQTYPIHELIIQDDGSTDDTVAIARGYASRHAHIRVFVNLENLGFNLNFKSAAMRATGDFVAISDQDDVWFASKIERQVEAIGPHDICFSTHTRGSDIDHSHLVAPQYALEALLFGGFAGHTMLLRRDFIQDGRNWIDHIHYDWSLAICAQMARGIVRVEQPLNWHRMNDDSACANEMRSMGTLGKRKSTYEPYLYGWRNYNRLQRTDNWQRLYRRVAAGTDRKDLATAHEMATLMLRRGPWPLFRLCLLCLRHRATVYPSGAQKGLMGMVRGFFYPFIFAYDNIQYDLI